jgi:deoxyribose-phosphate aldolase
MQPFGRVNAFGLEERAAWLAKRSIKKESKLCALRTAVSMCDLTTLEGADTEEKVRSLIAKAIRPYSAAYGMPSEEEIACPPVAAICVYPNLVPFAKRLLTANCQLPTVPKIASVATGFPSGQSPLSTRLAEVKWAIKNGADEIDMVINRNAFLAGDYKTVHKEIEKTKQAMLAAWSQTLLTANRQLPTQEGGEGNNPQLKTENRKLKTDSPPPTANSQPPTPPHLKVILETGELGSYDAVRNASFIAMHAGADFIKTSTGKFAVSANLPVTLCMLEAIRDFYDQTGMRIGMKPAGGIRTAKQAVHYLVVVNETLGEEWLTPDLFRFGASSLLNDLLAQMVKQVSGTYRSAEEFSEV